MSTWRTVRVRDVASTFDGPHATPRSTKTATSGPIFLGISSLDDGRLDLAQSAFISEDELTQWTRRVTPQTGDVVFSYETRLGQAAIIPPGFRGSLGRRLALMRPDRARVDPRFLLYYYLSPTFQEVIRKHTVQGSTVDRILLRDFPDYPIELPHLEEQHGIAATLGALDDKIESNHRQVALANALADELWEGLTRASLSSCSIDDLAAAGTLLLSDGYRTRVDQLGVPGVPILRVADVSDDHFALRPEADHILDTYRPRFSEKMSMAGDVIVTTKGTVGRTALVGPKDVAAVYSPQICFIRSLDRDALPPAALHRWVRSESFRAQARQVQDQTDMAAYISLADFRRFRWPLVDTRAAELSEIAALDVLITARRQETSALLAARDTLLPELLSGRIRVPEAASAVDGLP